MSWLDLHMHSSFSNDGEFTPKELMEQCLRAGVRTAALADHNSVAGVEEAQFWAQRNGVSLVPATELDCVFHGHNLHVLGYFIDTKFAEFQTNHQNVLKKEKSASATLIARVKGCGINFDENKVWELAGDRPVSGEMIAEIALEDKDNADETTLQPYYPGGSRGDNPFVNFYWDFCSQGKPAYVPISYISLENAVSMIQKSGGIAILAHPGINVKKDTELLKKIMDQGVSGMEVFSSYHNQEQTAFYQQLAEEQGLLLTVGSDYHGKIKPMIALGGTSCNKNETDILSALLDKKDGCGV